MSSTAREPGISSTSSDTTAQRAASTSGALLVVGGAACLSLSAVFIKFADINAGTAAFLRCAIALVILFPIMLLETRRHRALPRPLRKYAVIAGVFLGIDYVMWTVSIMDIGAGVATVLLNVQIIAFPLLARVLGGTRIPRRFLYASPLMLLGLALAGGALDSGADAENPLRGALLGIAAGIAYAVYLYLIRLCGLSSPQHVVTPVCISTGSAALASGALALLTTGLPLGIPAASWGWIIALAVLGQVMAWLLVSKGAPRIAPNTAAALLLLQPVMAVVFAMFLLGETPTPTQLAGCAIVIAAVWFAHRAASPASASAPTSPSPEAQASANGPATGGEAADAPPSGDQASPSGDQAARR